MCEVCTNTSLKVNINQYDPTRTLTLRNAFVANMNRRFKQLARAVTKAVVTEDVFGLNQPDVQTYAQPIGQGAFVYKTTSEKIEAFLIWLRQMEDALILEFGTSAEFGVWQQVPWTNVYISKAYQQGTLRAQQELRKAGLTIILADEAGVIYINPVSVEKLRILYTRVFNELRGITTLMDEQISRILTQGLLEGQSPRVLARMINRAIIGGGDTLGLDIQYINKTGKQVSYFMPGRRRAEILARTEIIRAHHIATVQEYKTWGAHGVYVLAEWSTAGDGRVCAECAALEGTLWGLDEIEFMIPVHPQCFIDQQIPIYTSRGWKKIVDIKVGDRVLTHKHRFKKVTQLIRGKQISNVVKFKFKGNLWLSMTENHPVLVEEKGIKKWVAAKDITIEHRVFVLANKCKRCGKAIPYFRKYCSQSCLSKDITDRQWANPGHRKLISGKAKAQMKREYVDGTRNKYVITKKANVKTRQLVQDGKFHLNTPELRELVRKVTNTPEMCRASSERMKKNNPMNNLVIREKARASLMNTLKNHPEKRLNVRMAKHRKSGRKTSIEKKVAKLLDFLGVDYVFQYPILRYNVDFAIPDLHIVIECDGLYWHKDKRADLKRQRKIEKEGWFVLRYTDVEINSNFDIIENELQRVLCNHTGRYNTMELEIEKITTYTTKYNKTTYNFSVADDESYIAKGIVVHNCRCVSIPFVDKTRTKQGGE